MCKLTQHSLCTLDLSLATSTGTYKSPSLPIFDRIQKRGHCEFATKRVLVSVGTRLWRSMSAKYQRIKVIGQGSYGRALLVKDKDGKLFVIKEVNIVQTNQREDALKEVLSMWMGDCLWCGGFYFLSSVQSIHVAVVFFFFSSSSVCSSSNLHNPSRCNSCRCCANIRILWS
jgi:hypothetical protein